MPALAELTLYASDPALSHLSGSLPEEWGSPTAFIQLSTFFIANLSVQGKLSGRSMVHIPFYMPAIQH